MISYLFQSFYFVEFFKNKFMDVCNNIHSILLGFQKVDVYLISQKSKETEFPRCLLLFNCGGLPHHFSNRIEQKSLCIFGVGWKAMPGLQSLGD